MNAEKKQKTKTKKKKTEGRKERNNGLKICIRPIALYF